MKNRLGLVGKCIAAGVATAVCFTSPEAEARYRAWYTKEKAERLERERQERIKNAPKRARLKRNMEEDERIIGETFDAAGHLLLGGVAAGALNSPTDTFQENALRQGIAEGALDYSRDQAIKSSGTTVNVNGEGRKNYSVCELYNLDTQEKLMLSSPDFISYRKNAAKQGFFPKNGYLFTAYVNGKITNKGVLTLQDLGNKYQFILKGDHSSVTFEDK